MADINFGEQCLASGEVIGILYYFKNTSLLLRGAKSFIIIIHMVYPSVKRKKLKVKNSSPNCFEEGKGCFRISVEVFISVLKRRKPPISNQEVTVSKRNFKSAVKKK